MFFLIMDETDSIRFDSIRLVTLQKGTPIEHMKLVFKNAETGEEYLTINEGDEAEGKSLETLIGDKQE